MKQETVELPVEILPHAAGLPLPAYMSAGAAGMDLYAAVKAVIGSGAVRLIPTGLKAAVPAG